MKIAKATTYPLRIETTHSEPRLLRGRRAAQDQHLNAGVCIAAGRSRFSLISVLLRTLQQMREISQQSATTALLLGFTAGPMG